MKKYIQNISLLVAFAFISIAHGQVNSNQPVTNAITGLNPFMDASTNFNDATSIGKGLVFPRTDLTTWTFFPEDLDGIVFPTAFDGMIVYNSATGNTLTGQGIVTAVTPGYYYFSNPTGTDTITDGQWKPITSSEAQASKWTNDPTNTQVALTNLSDGTTARPAGKELVVTDAGYVGIGTVTPKAHLHVEANLSNDPLSSTDGAGYVHNSLFKSIFNNTTATTGTAFISNTSSYLELPTGISTFSNSSTNETKIGGADTSNVIRNIASLVDASTIYPFSGTLATAIGNYTNINFNGALPGAVVKDATGAYIGIYGNDTSGTVERAIGVRVQSVNARGTSGSTTRNAYGIYIDNNVLATGGTVNNMYSIYSLSTAPSYFAGNIGIGVLAPVAALHVSKSFSAFTTAGDSQDIFTIQANAGNVTTLRNTIRRHTAGSSWQGTNQRMQRWIDSATPHAFIDYGIDGLSGNTGLGFGSGTTTNMVIESNGNIGVGTTAPTHKLVILKDGTDMPTYSPGVSFTQRNIGTLNGAAISAEGYGGTTNLGGGALVGVRSRGTIVAPTAILAGDNIAQFIARGYNGTTMIDAGTIKMAAEEDFTSTATGSYMQFAVGALGTTSQQEVMRLTAATNVGIGTSTPTAKLQVSKSFSSFTSAGNSLDLFTIQSSAGNPTYLKNTMRRHTAGSDWTGTNMRAQRYVDAVAMGFIDYGIDGLATNYGLGFGSGTTTHMVISASGNIGIGTTAPTSKLQVVGLPIHVGNAAALTAGLTVGAFYHTGDGIVRVVY